MYVYVHDCKLLKYNDVNFIFYDKNFKMFHKYKKK